MGTAGKESEDECRGSIGNSVQETLLERIFCLIRLSNGTIFALNPQPNIVELRWLLLLVLLAGCQPSTPPPPIRLEENTPSNVIRSTGTIGAKGTISQAFDRAKAVPLDAYNAQQSLNKLFKLRYAQPDHQYELWTSTSRAVVRFVYRPNAFETFVVLRSSGNIFVASRQEIETVHEKMGMRGELQSSLWVAMTAQDVPPDVIWRFADVFGSRIDFLTEPRQGDSFRMIWTRERHDKAIRDGDILAASYKSQSGEEVMAFLFDGEYYDQNGRSMRGQFLRAPLSYRRISSGFTRARFHPVLRYYRPHHGTDYAAPKGTPVQSIAEGLVIAVGWDGGLGKAIRVRHAGSYVSIYGHLSSYAGGLHVGQRVAQGQFIGRVGSTGLSSGPHLHFGFEKGGVLVDFLRQKFELKARTVPDKDLDRFREVKKKALQELADLGNVPRSATVIP